MRSPAKSPLVVLCAFLLVWAPWLAPAMLAATPPAQQPQHVVSSADLQNAVTASLNTRQANVSKVEDFLSSSQARRAMKKAGLNYQQVRDAVPMLSSSELADLSARADRAERQFKAGSLTNQQITYIIIALATAVIILIIVEH